MGALPQSSHPDLLVDTGDDAAVWAQGDGKVLISTADFFGPLVDDPHLWGQIAAANAASDVYAMGGKPLFALNLVCWPGLGLEVLSEVLAGGAAAAERGGWNVVGGHTVTGPEPLYGQAVTGEAHTSSLLTLAGGQEGQSLVLTKPLGTGIITTAAMRRPAADSAPGGDMHEPYQAAVTEMLRLNDIASQVAIQAGATVATDITGFGLLGHLHKLCVASGLAAVLDVDAIPVLPGAKELAAQGYTPGGTQRNLDFVAHALDISKTSGSNPSDIPTNNKTSSDNPDEAPNSSKTFGNNPDDAPTNNKTTSNNPNSINQRSTETNTPIILNLNDPSCPLADTLALLADPQTSGGLLFACPPTAAEEAVAHLTTQNHTATIIGTLALL